MYIHTNIYPLQRKVERILRKHKQIWINGKRDILLTGLKTYCNKNVTSVQIEF